MLSATHSHSTPETIGLTPFRETEGIQDWLEAHLDCAGIHGYRSVGRADRGPGVCWGDAGSGRRPPSANSPERR